MHEEIMSVQPKFENVFPVTENSFPIVFRLEGLHPKDIWRILMHDRRRGGDLSHVDPAATPFNERLLGEPDWDLRIKSEIRAAQEGNFAEKIRALEAKSRKKDAEKFKVLGLSDPWNSCSDGPLREGIITVNKDWFGGAGIAKWDKGKVAEFKARAMDFLQESFPNGQLRYASGHADEEAFHIHFVVAVWREKVSKHSGRQLLLQASANPLIARYETAQDLAGEAFAPLGITRGERRAEAARAAKAAGQRPPEKRAHVPPSQWRTKLLADAQADAVQVLSVAQEGAREAVGEARDLGEKVIRKARKRAVKEARLRREAADRDVKRLERGKVALTETVAHLRDEADAARDACEQTWGEVAALRDRAAEVTEEIQGTTAELRLVRSEIAEEREYRERFRKGKEEAERARDKARAEALVAEGDSLEQKEMARELREKLRLVQERALEEERGWELKRERVGSELALEEEKLGLVQALVVEEEKNLAMVRQEVGAITDRMTEEKNTLRAVENDRKDGEKRLAEARRQVEATKVVVAAVEEGLEAVCAGTLAFSEQENKVNWGENAPQDVEERKQVGSRLKPGLPLITKIAAMAARVVKKRLAVERERLRGDLAFVSGLRAQLSEAQAERLSGIGDRHGFDKGIR
ncbi:plasmid recombination protein [Rhodobacter viridis]|nr:plasmid recombination protein [Rhodobacter viridis]